MVLGGSVRIFHAVYFVPNLSPEFSPPKVHLRRQSERSVQVSYTDLRQVRITTIITIVMDICKASASGLTALNKYGL